MQDAIISDLLSKFNACKELYESFTGLDAPDKKAWVESQDTEPHEEAVADLLAPVREAAVESNDPGYLVALLDGVNELLTEVKAWINSVYADATGKKMPTGSAEQLETMVKEFRKSFNAALALADTMPQVMNRGAIMRAIPTKDRKVRGEAVIRVPDLRTVIVKNRGVPKVRENDTRVKLVRNGEVVEADNLGIAVKSCGLTLDGVWKELASAYPDVKSPWTKFELFQDRMFTIGEDTYGLRKVK